MTIHRALHPQAAVDRLYIHRKNGGRGMISVKNCAEMKTESLNQYAENSNERLFKAVEEERILGGKKTKNEILEKRRKNFMEK